MDFQLINITECDKKTLINSLKSKISSIEDTYNFSRVERLCKALRDDIKFVLEEPYVDYHYRDSFYSFYSSKFSSVKRDTIRVHIFSEEQLKKYFGYFIIRPLNFAPLGRAFISPEAFSNHRMLPSKGLSLTELSTCLNSCGQNCMVYCIDDSNRDFHNSMMRIYIESGMPFIVVLNNNSVGHAIVAIGHENFSKENMLSFSKSSVEVWNDISSCEKKLVFIDDNFPPYRIASCNNPADCYSKSMQNMKIAAYIVPLHKHMYLDASSAFDLISLTFNDPNFGLEHFGHKWITRILLTSNESFKSAVNEDIKISKSLKKLILSLKLPKFIWICELYSEDSYIEGYSKGLLLLDSTGETTSLKAILFYIICDNMIVHDGLKWIKSIQINTTFEMNTYMNNLKGDWNKWEI